MSDDPGAEEPVPPRLPDLETDPNEMRRLGYAAVDRIVDHLSGLRAGHAWSMITREAGETALREPPPEEGAPLEGLMDTLERHVFAHRARVGHPRFFAFVPGSPTYASILGDILTAGHNPFVGTWLGGSGPSMLELVVVEWIREMTGLPPGSGGLLASGGSAATLIALTAARHARLGEEIGPAAVYASDQTHACVERAAGVAGIPHYVRIPTGRDFRLPLPELADAIKRDRKRGLRPFLVVANAGTTNTGSIDPLPGLSDYCRSEGLWLHVDAAYGGFSALTERGRRALLGIEGGDSWVFDPHKWLYVGIECGSVLLARPEELRDAFHVLPDYMRDVDLGGERINFADYGFQLSRTARAVKVWLSLKHHGLAGHRRVIDRMLTLAGIAEARLRESGDFEILSPARLGIVCFRLVRPGLSEDTMERWNVRVQDAINASGFAFLSSTRLLGNYSLRLCILSRTTTEEDVVSVIERIREVSDAVRPE